MTQISNMELLKLVPPDVLYSAKHYIECAYPHIGNSEDPYNAEILKNFCVAISCERDSDFRERIGELFNFQIALSAVRKGKKICREGWNGKGMWICYGEGRIVESEQFWNKHTREFAEQNGGSATVGAYLIFKSAQGNIEMGWRPTSIDMFAEDWMVLPEPQIKEPNLERSVATAAK